MCQQGIIIIFDQYREELKKSYHLAFRLYCTSMKMKSKILAFITINYIRMYQQGIYVHLQGWCKSFLTFLQILFNQSIFFVWVTFYYILPICKELLGAY